MRLKANKNWKEKKIELLQFDQNSLFPWVCLGSGNRRAVWAFAPRNSPTTVLETDGRLPVTEWPGRMPLTWAAVLVRLDPVEGRVVAQEWG